MWHVQSNPFIASLLLHCSWCIVVKCLWLLLSIGCFPSHCLSHCLLNPSMNLKDTQTHQLIDMLMLLVAQHYRMSKLMSRLHRYLSKTTTAEVVRRTTLQMWQTKPHPQFCHARRQKLECLLADDNRTGHIWLSCKCHDYHLPCGVLAYPELSPLIVQDVQHLGYPILSVVEIFNGLSKVSGFHVQLKFGLVTLLASKWASCVLHWHVLVTKCP